MLGCFCHSLAYGTRHTLQCCAADPQPCQWSAWSEWGACNATCEGFRFRERTIEVPAANGGAACEGPSMEAEVCGGSCSAVLACSAQRPDVLTGTTGTFGLGTPNGEDYKPQSDCQWLVQATPTQQVRMWFTWIDIEKPQGATCNFDWVAMVAADGTVLQRVCGATPDGSTAFDEVSTTGAVTVEFHSDVSNQGKGFSVSYEITDVGGALVSCTCIFLWGGYPRACGGAGGVDGRW